MMLIRFGLLALIFFLCTPAHSETGNTLLQACEALEREVRLSGTNVWLPNKADVHKCWGYMSAVQDLSGAEDETGKRLLGYCPDPKTNLTQHIRVFNNYAGSDMKQSTTFINRTEHGINLLAGIK
jgi:hypothetical protein